MSRRVGGGRYHQTRNIPDRDEDHLRTLAMTQNITVDGCIEMIDDWFDPESHAAQDNSDVLEEIRRQDADADALLLGRQTFEDFRSYWPEQTDDTSGITAYLNQVREVRRLLDADRARMGELDGPRR